MLTASFARSWAWGCLALACLVLSQVVGVSRALAVDPQYQCTAQGVVPGSECTAVKVMPWAYTDYNLGYGKSLSEWYHSETAVERAIWAAFMDPGNSSWCSMTLTSISYDTTPNNSSAGIPTEFKDQLNYDVVAHNTGTSPCTQQWSIGPTIQKITSVGCPAGFALIYGAGPPAIGPYCARPWNTEAEEEQYGSCESGELRRGNPCNVTSRNKYEEEIDYQGNGDFPLLFRRAYNSRRAYRYDSQDPASQRWYEPLGMGWTATYFQRLIYSGANGRYSVFARRPDDKEITFNQVGTEFIAEFDRKERLSAQFDAGGAITQFSLTTPDGIVETYNAQGLLLSVRNRAGITHTVSYDASNYPTGVTHSSGGTLAFQLNASHRLVKVIDPAGGEISYQQNSSRNLTSVTYQDGTSRTYHYEYTTWGRWNQLTGITDEGNNRYATWLYNNSGDVTTSHNGNGVNRYTFSYTASGRTVTDPLLTVRTYTTTVAGGLRRITGTSSPCSGCEEPKAQSYDLNGNVTMRRDFRDIETHYTYDLARNLEMQRTEAYGTARARTIATQWHPVHRLPTQIDEPGKRMTFTHDAAGNVLTKTALDTNTSESRTWSYTYNGYGQVLTADGPRTDVNDVTLYTYHNCNTGYQCGQVETITNSLGHTTTYHTYNAHGQPLTFTDPNGVTTTLTYDLRQRLTSRTMDSEVTSFTYWPTGLLKKAALPDGSYLEYTYDTAHRLTAINDAEGNRISYTLDAMGNRTKEDLFDPSNALTNTRTHVFNTLNRLSQEIGAAGGAAVTTSFGYDNNGNHTSINAPLGRDTSQTYDELNRLTSVTDPTSGVTQYGYNALDQLISVTDPRGKVTSYTHNALGDLVQQLSPDTGTTTNTFDAAGNLKTKTDARGKTVTYSHDALNRVTQAVWPDQTIQYGYDISANALGRLTSVSDYSGQTSWTYDPHGRITSRQQSMGSVMKNVSYGYDNAGRLSMLTLPSGHFVQYGYTNGKVTSLTLDGSTTILSSVLYEPFGPVSGWNWGNGTIAARGFDLDGNVQYIDNAGLKHYAYDNAFRITGISDATDPNLSQSFGYDLLDRLTSATGTGLNQSWTYDANGNRLTQGGATSTTYSVASSSNRLLSTSGALAKTYTYDAAGNITGDGAAMFTYDDAGRMIAATKAGLTTSYQHNALGQRVKKSNLASTTHFVYDESGHLIGEYDTAGNLIQEIVWLGDTPVASLRMDESGTSVGLFYIHTDHLNTPRKMTRPTDEAVVWQWESGPFGDAQPNEDPDGNGLLVKQDLRFPGQYLDQETGLIYNYFRDYDPRTGRYWQGDPVGLQGDPNPYVYVEGNPLRWVDRAGTTREMPNGNPLPGLSCVIGDARGGSAEVSKLPPGSKGPIREGVCGKIEDCQKKCQCKYDVSLSLCGPSPSCIMRAKRTVEQCVSGCD